MLSRGFRSAVVLGRAKGCTLAKSSGSRSWFLVANNRSLIVTRCNVLQLRNAFSTQKADDKESSDVAAESDPKAAPKSSAVTKYDYDEYDDYEEPKTAGQKVQRIF